MLRSSLPFCAVLLAAVSVAGCGVQSGPADPPDNTRAPCGYPDAIAPMAENEALEAYRWEAAKRMADGSDVAVDLAQAHCDTSETIDWSPFDVLLFVSIPAW